VNCEFYAKCLEQAKPCGIAGYALSYGKKYCNKFTSQTFHSQRAQIWLKSAMKCLQEELLTVVKNPSQYTCDQVVEYAFDSHPKCYTKKGASICDILDPRDLTKILFTVDGSDLFSRKSFKQIKEVAAICLFKGGHSLADEIEEAADMLELIDI
jgi:hypothetical protein